MHGRVVIFIDQDDDLGFNDFIDIGAVAISDKYGYNTWRNEWMCKSKEEILEVLRNIVTKLSKKT